MASTYRILGQAAPAATTTATVYTVPAGRQAIINTFTVCNRASSTGTFRIAIRPSGATLANQHYQVFDSTCAANDSLFLNVGWALSAGDVVEVFASTANFSFTASGVELT